MEGAAAAVALAGTREGRGSTSNSKSKEDYDELHNKVRRSVVKIRTTKGQWTIVYPGTIISIGKSFCYVIAHRSTFVEGPQASYEVIFPDSNMTTVKLDVSNVAISNNIAAFYIFNAPFGINMVQPVHLSKVDALANQKVYTLCVPQDISKPTFLSPGYVNSAGVSQFIHDCRPDRFTPYGAPVFHADGSLLGICCTHCSVLLAYNIPSIGQLLSKIHTGETSQAIEDILLHIEAQVEAGAGVP